MGGVFGIVIARSLVKNLQFCGEAYCLHFKVPGSSEMSHLYFISLPHIPQDGVPHFKAPV